MLVLGVIFIRPRTIIQVLLVNIRVMEWMLEEFLTFIQLLTLCLLQGFVLLVRQIKEIPKLGIFFFLNLMGL